MAVISMPDLLRISLQDPYLAEIERELRGEPDGARRFAGIVARGTDRLGIAVDQEALVRAISERWERSS